MNVPLTDEKFYKKFWSNVTKTDTCWLWNAAVGTQGYGVITRQYKKYTAHRIAYSYTYGDIPEKKEIDHLCENKICVRPDHLMAVTRAEHWIHTKEMVQRQIASNQSAVIDTPAVNLFIDNKQ
jgi:hypothetical protein